MIAKNRGGKHVEPSAATRGDCCITLSIPAAAQAPAPTTAFDGKYAGVSKESSRFVSGGERAHCAEYPKGVPASLTIMNDVIRSAVGG
jgi:hypothetical protein